MKTKYIYILFTILTLSGCQKTDDFLDVIPTGLTIPETLEDFDKMMDDYAILRSRYENIRFIDPDVYHNQASFTSISSNNVRVSAYLWEHDIFGAEGSDSDYEEIYYYIHVMNQVLQEVDGAPAGNFNAANRNVLKAQALGQRAMELFYAVNIYAHHYDPANLDASGVAMPLEIDLQAQLDRTAVGKVYEQIIKDLNQALSLLPSNYPAIEETANFRPGRASIYALLAEVYLYMGDFEAAKTNSNTALSLYNTLYDYNDAGLSNPSNFWSGYTEPYRSEWSPITFNKEELWARYNYYSLSNPFHLYSPELEALYDKSNDSRWRLFATQTSSSGIDVSPNYVYGYPRGERQVGMTVPRLMLTNAEAKARTNDGPGAITVLNTLLQNRIENFVPLSHTTDVAALQRVKEERRKELAGTSLNLFDQKRYHVYGDAVPTYTRTNPDTGTTATLAPGDDGYVVKIAQSIINLNPNLE